MRREDNRCGALTGSTVCVKIHCMYKISSLNEFRISNFCSLASVTLRLGRVTVLVGANGAGKSNVLRALRMVALMRARSLQRFAGESGGASSLLHYGPKKSRSMDISLVWSNAGPLYDDVEYRAVLEFVADDKFMYSDENLIARRMDNQALEARGFGSGHSESRLSMYEIPPDVLSRDRLLSEINDFVSKMSFFHFHDTSLTAALRTHARLEDDQALRSDGGNLAACLYRLQQSQDAGDRRAWVRIHAYVRRIAPSVKELCPTPVGERAVRLDWIDERDERFGAHQLSDGTLRAIALIAALAQPVERLPRLISIDEPELGLHPAAISVIAELARAASRHVQILLATQSTILLDHFAPEEVVVVEREGGCSVLRRLDPAALQVWLEEYTLSELFNKGVIGGRP